MSLSRPHPPVEVVLQQVSHVYDRQVVALRDVTLTIKPGEFTSIVGPSGCGKSTLLRLVAGLQQPTRGHIRLNHQPPDVLRRQKNIGWMAQQPALLPWRTVSENIRLPSQVNRQAERPTVAADAWLALVGLAEFAHAYPATLSGGMQQRVALARTLAIGASLWLMDEPFAALDELTRHTLSAEVRALWRRFSPTVLWVTHHITEAVRLSDRVVILSPRPGHIKHSLPVTLPHPRDDTSPAFQELVRHIRAVLGVQPIEDDE